MADNLALYVTEVRLLLVGWVRREPHAGFHSPGSLHNGVVTTYWSRSSRMSSARSLCCYYRERQARLRLRLADAGAGNLSLRHRSLATQALHGNVEELARASAQKSGILSEHAEEQTNTVVATQQLRSLRRR